jgi:hypothetical protein
LSAGGDARPGPPRGLPHLTLAKCTICARELDVPIEHWDRAKSAVCLDVGLVCPPLSERLAQRR